MTITTFTNVCSFGIGWFTPTPEIQLFCFGTLTALAVVYCLHFVLFCPALILGERFSLARQGMATGGAITQEREAAELAAPNGKVNTKTADSKRNASC